MSSYNDELCNLIWKRYNENPSAHLYALYVTFKEYGDLMGLCLYNGSEKIADIGEDIFWSSYFYNIKRYTYYNEKMLEIINKRNKNLFLNK